MIEEGRKRQREEKGGYTAVGFTYTNHNTPQEERGGTSTVQLPLLLPPPSLPEHPPTSTVDVAESDAERFIPPTELVIPGHIQQVRIGSTYIHTYSTSKYVHMLYSNFFFVCVL